MSRQAAAPFLLAVSLGEQKAREERAELPPLNAFFLRAESDLLAESEAA